MTDEPSGAVVVDASAIVALLTDDGPAGRWVDDTVQGRSLLAPELMPFEAANILRRLTASGAIDLTLAALAHADLADLSVELVPWRLVGVRAWELRRSLTIYDASYVALAEAIGAPVVTLDRRIGRAPGVGCPVLTP